MRKLQFFYFSLSILFLSCQNTDQKTDDKPDTSKENLHELFSCEYHPESVFPKMREELSTLNKKYSLIHEYQIIMDSLILNWDSLVASENYQIQQIAKVIERIELQPVFNKSKTADLKKSLCLVKSNRVPAHKLNDSIRLTMFDNLLEQLKIEASGLVLDLANIPTYTSKEEEQYIDQDSLLAQINDDILVESIYAVESHDKIIFINSQLYIEAAANYNEFIVRNGDSLRLKGVNEIYYFPGFYE